MTGVNSMSDFPGEAYDRYLDAPDDETDDEGNCVHDWKVHGSSPDGDTFATCKRCGEQGEW